MSDTFGTVLKITTFGESHSPLMGVVLTGLESGFTVSEEKIKEELKKRRPGSFGTTARVESDSFEIVSGLFEGKTTGAPLTILIHNSNYNSSDYKSLKEVYRPGHADETWQARFSVRDYRGGGRASGRETVCRVAAGAIAKQILETKGITISSHIESIHGKTNNWEEEIEKAVMANDSVGGIVSCTVKGIEKGIGEPVFDKLDAVISHAVMSIGAVKGIAFGSGFDCANLYGSENNKACHAGGILGGISDGNDIVFNVAVKPTPSIGLGNRHDACIALRIGSVIEAMTALVVLDQYYLRRAH